MSRHQDTQRTVFANLAKARADITALLLKPEGRPVLERLAKSKVAHEVAAKLPTKDHHHDSPEAMACVAAVLRSGDSAAITRLSLRTKGLRKALQNAPGTPWKRRMAQTINATDRALWEAAESVRGLAFQRCVRLGPGKAAHREDMLHAALIGAYQGAEKFDPERGIAFSSYSILWIDQAVQRSLEWTSGDIRVPTHIHVSTRRVARIRDRFRTEYGRWPTAEEVAKHGKVHVREAKAIMNLVKQPKSLHAPLVGKSERGDLLLIDCLRSDVESPEETLERSNREAKLFHWLSMLPKRESEILIARFGLRGREMKLEEVGKVQGVTRERIRQIETNALMNLRRVANGLPPRVPPTRPPAKHLLNLDLAREMRRRFAAGEDYEALANAFDVSLVTVKHVVRGRKWKEPVPQPATETG
jgi:RNA polymerase sigma factor (sigma-70 family)